MAESSRIPRHIERPCCPGKSCGNTQLWLDVIEPLSAWGERDIPALFAYRRCSNDEMYSGEYRTEAAMVHWLAASGITVDDHH